MAAFRVLLLSIFCLFACESEIPFDGNSYEDVLEHAKAHQDFNGNILVAENGQVVYEASHGLANFDPVDSLSKQSVFRLASVSKHFTAMGILILVDSGIVSLDEDVRTYLPELPYENITIRHLLNHTSGLPDYTSLLDQYWFPDLEESDPARFISGNEDIITVLASKKPEKSFEPGEQWEYSNTGYVVLATIITRLSGIPFDDYLKNYVFDKAGLEQTIVFDPIHNSPITERAFGFRVLGSKTKSNDIHFLNPAQGDGGIYSTTSDLFKWDTYLYNQQIVSSALLEMAYTPGMLNNGEETTYGFGWGIGENPDGNKIVVHSGGWVGFSTYFYRDLTNKHVIIVLTNNSSSSVRDLVHNLKTVLYEIEN